MSDHIERYQESALRETLRIAAEVPFYQEKWAEADCNSRSTNQTGRLRTLPILTKQELRTRLRPLLVGSDKIASIIHTTGSTGPVTYRYRSQRELDRIAHLGQAVIGNVRPKSRRPLAYMLYGPYHGQDLPGVGPIAEKVAPYYFSGAVWEDIFLRQGVELLRQSFDLPGMEARVTQVHGAVRLLRVFTQCLIDMGASPKEFSVEALVSFAGYMPTEVRDFLSAYWGTTVIEAFSFSETMGGATKCPTCRGLLFMPHLLPEVVGLETEQLISEGNGRLLVTELFPFGTTQPLVRYFNGDIVNVYRRGCTTCGKSASLVHVGRDNESCFVKTPDGWQLALGSMDLREAIYTKEVKRTTEFPHLKLLKDRDSHLGAPKVATQFADVDGRQCLTILFAPNTTVGLANTVLADRVRERLLATSTDLRGAVENGLLTLEVRADPNQDKVLWK
jgi:phenylacetate-coenzyme A ligase PaaK-like adenylate-forming protein